MKNDFSCALDELYHHQRVGAKWGKLNGPPYPLNPADYSAAQKKAVANGEDTVAKDAPKTSSKSSGSSKSALTDEEKAALHEAKRKAALASGDLKKIEKYIKESSNVELNEAYNKAQTIAKIKADIARLNMEKSVQNESKTEAPTTPQPKKETLTDKIKQAGEDARQKALASGDVKQIRAVAKDSTNSELTEALNKADTMAKLDSRIAAANYKPTTQDRINSVFNKLGDINKYVGNTIDAYNNVATIYNTFNGERSDLKIIGAVNSKMRDEAKKKLDKFEEDQEKRRAESVKAAIWSGDINKINAASVMMTSQEVKEAAERLDNMRVVNGKPKANQSKKKDKEDD